IRRTTLSDKSVTTPAAFLGHATHNIPCGFSIRARRLKFLKSSDSDRAKNSAKSRFAGRGIDFVPAGSVPSSLAKPSGALKIARRNLSLLRGFLRNGFQDYPAIISRR